MHPSTLLGNMAWAFYLPEYETVAAFSEAVQQYQLDIYSKSDWDPSAVILNAAKVRIGYMYWDLEEDDQLDAELLLEADNGISFTAGELLFKVHNGVAQQLDDNDAHFFEGFSLFGGYETKEVPLYHINLGS